MWISHPVIVLEKEKIVKGLGNLQEVKKKKKNKCKNAEGKCLYVICNLTFCFIVVAR